MSNPTPTAKAAADAARVASQVFTDYGFHSPEANSAIDAVYDAVDQARAAGDTDTDIKNA